MSATYPGVVKGWHYHKHQTDNFACVAGMVKLVLVDTRDGSPTNGVVNEFFVGAQNPAARAGAKARVSRVEVHQRGAIARRERPGRAYNRAEPDEYRLEPHGTLPYDWSRKDG